MAENDSRLWASIMAGQAAAAAKQHKSLFSSPGVNSALGFKTGGLVAPLVAGQRHAATTGVKPTGRQSNSDELQQKLLSRIKTVEETGTAVPRLEDGYIPGAALRPEVQALFKSAGGASAFYVGDMSPGERAAADRYLIDPRWSQANANPGSTLTDEEKQQALASAPVASR
jgi:hypothetical protein